MNIKSAGHKIIKAARINAIVKIKAATYDKSTRR